MPFHCQASHFHSFRLHAPPSQLWSRQSLSIPPPFRRGSCHNQSQRLHLHSQRPSSIRCPVNSTGRVAHRLRICACLRAAFPFAAMPLPNLSELCNTMSNQCFAPRISPLLRRIESSPLQSAPSRFRTSLLLSKQGRSFPLPLVSRRFRLCSALPYQILESRLQALPWLLVAFYGWAIPFLFRSLRLRWPRFQIGSFRLLSQLRHSSAMPIWANRFSAAPSHIVSPRLDAISGQIRSCPSISKPCPYDSNKAGLIASAAFRVRSMRIRSRQSPGSSAPPAPISAVLDLLYTNQLSSTQIRIWAHCRVSHRCLSASSQIRSSPRRCVSPPVRATRIHCLSERFGSQLRSAVATL